MCNRFRGIREWSDIPRRLQAGPRLNFDFNPNVAPTELVPVFLAVPESKPRTVIARFGINLTGREGKPRPLLLNARTDGMRRGQFRSHLKAQRCVIPAAGFYEFAPEEDRQPYHFYREDGLPLMLAGIWEESEYKGDRRPAFAILTEEPNELIAPYHDRMPLALADDQVDRWLDLSQAITPDASLLLSDRLRMVVLGWRE